MDPNSVLTFWFEEIDPKQWWIKDSQLDREISHRFGKVHKSATLGELSDWRRDPLGRLAEVIVLDQFSRNIYRNDPRSFAYDGMALVLAQECVSLGEDQRLSQEMRPFIYMPFMHSESKIIHETAVQLFSSAALKGNLDFELQHKKIIDRFGRYPHRNKILGRESTPEELVFLNKPGSSF